jgi:porin
MNRQTRSQSGSLVPFHRPRRGCRLFLRGLLIGLLSPPMPAMAQLCAAPATTAESAAPPAPAPESKPTGLWTRDTLTGDWGGLRPQLTDCGVTFGLQEQSEVWGNLMGGRHAGSAYDGLTTASLKLNLNTLLDLPDTVFFINAFQIHGRGPSARLVGNLQVVSNIEATSGTRLYDFWLQTELLDRRLDVRIGQEGVDDEMMITQYGALLLNSSFGFPAMPSADLPSGGPSYPLATPFIRLKYAAGGGFTLVGALYNGDPAPPGTGDPQLRDGSGTTFRLNDHVLAFTELWYTAPGSTDVLPTTYKLGAWFDSARFADQYYDTSGLPLAASSATGVAQPHAHDYGLYGIIDQVVWRRPGTQDQGIGVFLEAMGGPGDRNITNLFFAAGMNWKAPFADRTGDSAGIGVSYQGISPSARHYSRDLAASGNLVAPYASNEMVIEATYLYQMAPWWLLQPDVQYVVNPGAGLPGAFGSRPLKDDLIVGLHTTVTF